MTTATATRIPTISATSTPNFYDVLSSDNKTHYPMLVEGPGQVICGCPAGSNGRNCYHRTYAVANMIYIDENVTYRLAALEEGLKELNAAIWAAIEAQADDAADREAYETMMANEAA
jgi:hypothetical protein